MLANLSCRKVTFVTTVQIYKLIDCSVEGFLHAYTSAVIFVESLLLDFVRRIITGIESRFFSCEEFGRKTPLF